jgi:hypothetical protein
MSWFKRLADALEPPPRGYPSSTTPAADLKPPAQGVKPAMPKLDTDTTRCCAGRCCCRKERQ